MNAEAVGSLTPAQSVCVSNSGSADAKTALPALLTPQKRKKTNRACNHCHKAHMTCDTSRPCQRCVQKGLQNTCQDAPRKRKKYLEELSFKMGNLASPTLDTPSPKYEDSFTSTSFVHSASVPNGPYIPISAVPTRANSTTNIKQEPNSGFYSTSQLYSGGYVEPPLFSQPQGPLPMQQIQQQNRPVQRIPPPQSQASHLQQSYGKKRTNFLSLAADLEYSTLLNILQDNLAPHNHLTSTEGTPGLSHISPALSPHNHNGATVKSEFQNSVLSPISLSNNAMAPISLLSPYNSAATSPKDRPNGSKNVRNASYPKCDEQINQYFLGPTDKDHVQYFPDVTVALEAMQKMDPAVYRERNTRLTLSFAIGILPEGNHLADGPDEVHNVNFKEPEEIYAKVSKPFSYTPGYHSLIAYLRRRFPKEMLVKMAESMAAYRPSFIACTNSLKEGDLIFMEQCFQRTLLTYDNFIKVSGTPTIVWRRTGEIAYVGSEFSILTGWSKEELIKKRTFIVELLDDKLVVEYFQLFLRIAFGDFLGATMTECTLLTPNNIKIRTGCMWTLKRDVFGIPMMIIGNFLPII